jgi:hypothetical protein
MTYDLGKVIRYGQKIGANHALVLNGRLRKYYKKGDRSSNFSPYMYDINLRWENTNMSSLSYVLRCYRASYPDALIIDIPDPETA